MLHFTIKEDGKLYVFKDLPEEPVKEPSFGNSIAADKYMQLKTRYNIAIQRAKDNAIEVDNQREVKACIIEDINEKENRPAAFLFINSSFKKDTIYSLEGCEMKVKKTPIHPEHIGCDITDCLDFARCQDSEGCRDAFTYVALITFSEKKEDKPTPEPENLAIEMCGIALDPKQESYTLFQVQSAIQVAHQIGYNLGRKEVLNWQYLHDLVKAENERKGKRLYEEMQLNNQLKEKIAKLTSKQMEEKCNFPECNCFITVDNPICEKQNKPTPEKKEEETQAIRLRDMAITYDLFLMIKNNTVNNGKIIADRMMRLKESIQADFFHSKETNQKIAEKNAVDLTTRLLKSGYEITLLDGDWSVLQSVSPPLYDKYIIRKQSLREE
jgi:hypothetical protein